MKSLWKSLWVVCALAGALVGAAGCGPQQAYCPNTGTNGICPIVGDEGGVLMPDSGITGLTCDAGFKPGFNSTDMYTCIPI